MFRFAKCPGGVHEGQLETSHTPATSSLFLSPPLPRSLAGSVPSSGMCDSFPTLYTPNRWPVKEQCGADPRWHSRLIVCSLGWCVTVCPSASAIVEPHSLHRASVGMLLCAAIQCRWQMGLARLAAPSVEEVHEAGPILTLQSDCRRPICVTLRFATCIYYLCIKHLHVFCHISILFNFFLAAFDFSCFSRITKVLYLLQIHLWIFSRNYNICIYNICNICVYICTLGGLNV